MRFFAALAVVLCHVGFQFTNTSSVNVAESYGYIGVSFFFVLSGLVLTWSYSGQSAQRFVWRRLCRIWPLQFLVALFAFTALASQEKGASTAGHVLEVVLLQAWSPKQKIYFGGNGVSWSLSCELFFYVLFPLVIRPLRRLGGRGLLLTTFGTVAVMAIAPAVALGYGVSAPTYYWLFFVFPPYRFGEFFLGMVLARAVQLGLRAPRPQLSQLVACGCLAGVVYSLTRYTVSTGSDVSRPYVALFVLPFLLVLILGAVTLDVSSVPSWLSARPLLRLGEWSFALYLVHKPIFLLTEQWNWWNRTTGVFGDVAGFCGFCLLIVVAAALLYYGVERPLERALRRAPDHLARLFVVAPNPASGDAHPRRGRRYRPGANLVCRVRRAPVANSAPSELDVGGGVLPDLDPWIAHDQQEVLVVIGEEAELGNSGHQLAPFSFAKAGISDPQDRKPTPN